jgi:hypothetical protein
VSDIELSLGRAATRNIQTSPGVAADTALQRGAQSTAGLVSFQPNVGNLAPTSTPQGYIRLRNYNNY